MVCNADSKSKGAVIPGVCVGVGAVAAHWGGVSR